MALFIIYYITGFTEIKGINSEQIYECLKNAYCCTKHGFKLNIYSNN